MMKTKFFILFYFFKLLLLFLDVMLMFLIFSINVVTYSEQLSRSTFYEKCNNIIQSRIELKENNF